MNNPVYYMAAFWVVSSAIRAMPDPQANASALYRWLFGFVHLLLANWDKVAIAMPNAAATATLAAPPENK